MSKVDINIQVRSVDSEEVETRYQVVKKGVTVLFQINHEAEEVIQAAIDILRVMGYADKTIWDYLRERADDMEDRYEPR